MDLDEMEGQLKGFKAITNSLENKIQKIESSNKQISKRIKNIEVQGLQDQLTSFHKELLKSSRFVATSYINHLEYILKEILRSRINDITLPIFIDADKFVSICASAKSEKVKKSLNPIDVADEYSEDCRNYFKEHNIKGIRDY